MAFFYAMDNVDDNLLHMCALRLVAFFSTGNSRHPHVSKYWSESIPKRIKEARANADLVIISSHAGKEYVHVPEEDLQRRYRSWVDAGADLVMGNRFLGGIELRSVERRKRYRRPTSN